ncbi:molybdate ABC transporter substrate-binding protein [Aquipuribacter sp. MA13-6]|uniref:molybdate ABC transporter substrate-binding protein n=1 Tax=unclassified Aquipuribacter TaxID=2635084 RepID=UPI003EE82719
MTAATAATGAGTAAARGTAPLGVLVLVALLAAGCGAGPTTGPQGGGTEVDREVVVHAAASLTDTFTLIAEDFMAEHPGTTVVLSFAGSSALATQVVQGAPGDVLATASPATMQTVVDAGGVSGEPTTFVTNTLQIAVPPDNPGDVTALVDLTDEARTVALCAVEVPCGAAARAVFDTAGLTPAPDTLEQDVRAALTKVGLGEVDAALVYRTDVIAAGDAVLGVDFPESSAVVNDYPVATLAGAADPVAAQAFVDHVLSPAGLEVLTDAGFGTP